MGQWKLESQQSVAMLWFNVAEDTKFWIGWRQNCWLLGFQNPADKGSFVALINSSMLGKGDDPNEPVSLTRTFIAQQR